jgi:hypothetical protein
MISKPRLNREGAKNAKDTSKTKRLFVLIQNPKHFLRDLRAFAVKFFFFVMIELPGYERDIIDFRNSVDLSCLPRMWKECAENTWSSSCMIAGEGLSLQTLCISILSA